MPKQYRCLSWCVALCIEVWGALQARRLVRDSILGLERPQVDLDDQDWLDDLAQVRCCCRLPCAPHAVGSLRACIWVPATVVVITDILDTASCTMLV